MLKTNGKRATDDKCTRIVIEFGCKCQSSIGKVADDHGSSALVIRVTKMAEIHKIENINEVLDELRCALLEEE